MEMQCRLTVVGTRTVVHVSGELDLATLPTFRDHLARAVDEHRGQTVWVDLDGVTALDDTCLGMLLGGAGRARDAGGDLAVVCSDERLRQRFAVTGLDRAVTVATRLPR
jgi:anti-sigma B factor antagonist